MKKLIIILFAVATSITSNFAFGSDEKTCAELLQISEDTTDAAKKALADHFQNDPVKSKISNWKRVSKKTENNIVYRTFRSTDGTEITLSYDKNVTDAESENTTSGAQIRFPWKTFWTLDGSDETSDGDMVSFMCGRATDDNYIDDQHNPELEDMLAKIFHDREVSLGDTESGHSIFAKDGESRAALKRLIKERLTKAGAVLFVMPDGDEE
jgi:hypothetical protein